MKSVPATNTPSYVTTSRTNTRRWLRQSGGEEDGHRRRDAQSGAARTVCAPIRRTILLFPHALLLSGHITSGCIILRSHSFGVTVRRRARSWWYALISPVSPRGFSGQDLFSTSPRLQCQRSLEEIRASTPERARSDFFLSFWAVVALSEGGWGEWQERVSWEEEEGEEEGEEAESRATSAGLQEICSYGGKQRKAFSK